LDRFKLDEPEMTCCTPILEELKRPFSTGSSWMCGFVCLLKADLRNLVRM